MCRALSSTNEKCTRQGIYESGLCKEHCESENPVMDDCAICMEPLGSESILDTCSTCENSVHNLCHEKYSFGFFVKTPCVFCRSPMEFTRIQKYFNNDTDYNPDDDADYSPDDDTDDDSDDSDDSDDDYDIYGMSSADLRSR